jgi:hypothetical protein
MTTTLINHHNCCHCTDDSTHSKLLLVLCNVRTINTAESAQDRLCQLHALGG